MRNRGAALLLLALSIAVSLSAGGAAEPELVALETSYPLDVVATTGMVGDVVRQVAGHNGQVHVLMGEEVDPHLYRPTRADIARMQRADIIFYNGLHLEGRMGDTLVQLARRRPVYAITELVDEAILLDDDEYEGAFDPHLWMDVRLWMKAVEVVVTALSELDPAGAEEYRVNADSYVAELAELDAYVRQIMATIPRGRRVLVTAHDAFGYFGKAYDIEVIGVQGISTESEAGLEEINSLVAYIVDTGVSAVFAETTVPDRALTAVIEGAAARGQQVRIGGELFSDAMGPAGSYEGTYVGMIDHNATTIVRALGGVAPEGGFRGRLSR
ncbi:MAG: manganese transporter [Spirochaetaceae bacterium]|nr:MAG: manganese transporter [Spirochaetaceae bacterium]